MAKLAKDLRGIISNANDSALQLSAQPEELLSARSKESLAESEMVAGTTEKNLLGSESQAAIVSETNRAIVEVITGINQMTDNEAMLSSSSSSEAAQSTSAATEQQLAANQEISSGAQLLAELSEKLQSDMSRIKV